VIYFCISLTKIRTRRHISVKVLSNRIHEIPSAVLELLRWTDFDDEPNSYNLTTFRCECTKAQGKIFYFSLLKFEHFTIISFNLFALLIL
jgi:hypothetical protein